MSGDISPAGFETIPTSLEAIPMPFEIIPMGFGRDGGEAFWEASFYVCGDSFPARG